MKTPVTNTNDPAVERNISRSDMDIVIAILDKMPELNEVPTQLDTIQALEASVVDKASEVATNTLIVQSETATTVSNAASALASKNASALSETNAKTSETNAALSEANALAYKNSASGSATTATTKAGIATTKASEASASATNAATSATNASNFASIATTKAFEASDSATSAAASAGAAGTSATNAATSETNALASKNAAATSATNAVNSATAAASSATDALASKTNADASEVMAHKWAQEAEDVIVTGTLGIDDEYSAYHWAQKTQAAVGNITVDSLYDVDTAGIVDGGIITYNQSTGRYAPYDFRHNPYIGLNTTSGTTADVGQFTWNATEGTADLGLPNGVTLQLGQENNRLVRNNTASTILNGTVVVATGSLGASGRITVAPCGGTSNDVHAIYGVTTQDILAGEDGFITIDGKVRLINTSGSNVGETWNEGDVLYVKPNDNGRLTNVVPSTGELKVSIAKVIRAHATTGILEVRTLSVLDENAYEPRNTNIQSHIANRANPHEVTKLQIGLGNVDNTADNVKPVSVAQQTALNAKLDIANIIDNLTSIDTSKPLSANQGRALKTYIDSINALLTSNDTSLDELQEIINFIKQNKSTLDALGISNIAGLQLALDAKANIADVYTKTSLDLKISTQQFDKPTRGPLFVKVSPSSIKIPAGLKITVGTESFKVLTDYTLTLASNLVGSTKTAGTDYYVYAKSDATFYISANDAITTDRLIGGFHYGLIGETETVTGNKLEADMVKIRGINQYSFWDLKYRPVASPKGMVNIGGKWYDIYLLNSEHITNGTSKAGLTIAGGDSVTAGRLMPKIPLEYGGNNTLNYGKFTWFQACEVAKANAKRLISYSEFPTIAYGVLEGVSSSINAYETVAGKIEHYPNLTSKYGIEQATGVQYIWGADLANYPTDTTWAWKANTDSRGQIYSTANSPTAVILGGHRGFGVVAGSRASSWDSCVWNSCWDFGCRFACDHLELA